MWKDYSKSYIRYNRASGLQICAAALTASSVRRCVTKSKTVSSAGIELTLEVRLESTSAGFVNRLAQIPGVRSAVLVSYNGEYMS